MTKRIAMVSVWMVVGVLSACDEATSPCIAFGTVVDIDDNHPNGSHVLEVSSEDVAAGDERSYDIQGNNTGHGHTVTLSAEDFASLQDGDPVTVESSDTGAAGNDHTHTVTISCATE
jgi:hypothetical protein